MFAISLLRRLRCSYKSINVIAMALLLTESRFRKLPWRISETIIAIFSLYCLRKEPTLTMGKCQVAFRYWRDRYGENNFRLLWSTFDDVSSYQVCCDYLVSNSRTNIRDILICYNGRPSTLYVREFQRNRALVEMVINRDPALWRNGGREIKLCRPQR